MIVKLLPPFDFKLTLRFALSPPALNDGRQMEPLLDHFEEGEYRRTLQTDEQPILYGVREEIGPEGACLRVRILAGPDDPVARRNVQAAVKKQFSADLDLKPFYQIAQSDPVLVHLSRHYCGMRIPQSPSVFECLISAVLEQQINLAFAHKVKRALIRTYGVEISSHGGGYFAFPTPAVLARTTPSKLRKLQISGPKSRYIINLSRAVEAGSLDLAKLPRLSPAEARAEMTKHKGVGPWTAHYVGLRALGHCDSLPAADVGLQKAIQRFYGLRKQPSAERVEKMGKTWRNWRSYATFYLWMTFWESKEWRDQLRIAILKNRKSRK